MSTVLRHKFMVSNIVCRIFLDTHIHNLFFAKEHLVIHVTLTIWQHVCNKHTIFSADVQNIYYIKNNIHRAQNDNILTN